MGKSVRRARVLITGAASGMGKLYAQRAVAEGAAAIVLWDVDEAGLARLVAELQGKADAGTTVRSYAVDLTESGAIAQTAQRVRKDVGAPDVLINNAGVVSGKLFWEHDPERDIRRTMAVNTLAPMYVAREFLPDMIADSARPKRLVNIASAAGLVSNPRMSVYAASKWAALGWSDSVRLELEKTGHRRVKVTTVCPSYVSTGMFAGAKGMLLTPIMTPEHVVDRVWAAMLRGRPLVILPRTVYLARALRALLPIGAADAVSRAFGIYSSMDEFTGRPAAGSGSASEGRVPETAQPSAAR